MISKLLLSNCTENLANLLFRLPGELRLTGTTDSYYDTLVPLFNPLQDFTILIDYTPGKQINTGDTQLKVLHCVHEISPWAGIDVSWHKSGNANNTRGSSNPQGYNVYTTGIGEGIDSTKRVRLGIVYTNETKSFEVYDYIGLVGKYTSNTTLGVSIPEAVILGCYRSTSNVKSNYWVGKIHSLELWKTKLDTTRINKYINTTHNKDSEYSILLRSHTPNLESYSDFIKGTQFSNNSYITGFLVDSTNYSNKTMEITYKLNKIPSDTEARAELVLLDGAKHGVKVYVSQSKLRTTENGGIDIMTLTAGQFYRVEVAMANGGYTVTVNGNVVKTGYTYSNQYLNDNTCDGMRDEVYIESFKYKVN